MTTRKFVEQSIEAPIETYIGERGEIFFDDNDPTAFTPAYPLTKHVDATLFLGMTDSENMLYDGANNLVPDINSGFTVRYSQTPSFI